MVVMKSKRLLVLSILLLFIAIVGFVYSKIEWVEKTTDLGPGPETKRQHYLAAQKLLALDEVSLEVEQGYARLDSDFPETEAEGSRPVAEEWLTYPSIYDSIIIDNGYGSLSERRAEKLLEWVDAGGHLVVTATNPFLTSLDERKDYIFDYFGVFVLSESELPEIVKEELEEKEPDSTTDAEDQSESLKAALENELNNWSPTDQCWRLLDNMLVTVYDDVSVTLGFRGRSALSFSEDVEERLSYWNSNNTGIQIIQTPHGDGLVTFLTELDAWKNDYIACLDNAYLLRFFVGGSERVWILSNQDSPSILSLFWQAFPYFISIAFALTGLVLWRYGLRFGDILASESLHRRSIIEHIEASALFLWRQRTSRWALVEAVKHSIARKMSRRYASFESKSLPAQCELIASATLLPVEDIKAAMSIASDAAGQQQTGKAKTKELSEQDFLSLIKALKNIEDKL